MTLGRYFTLKYPLYFILMVGVINTIQRARQEELITELEGELEATQSKLQNREKELEMWKDRVRRFTEVSFGSGSGSGAPTALILDYYSQRLFCSKNCLYESVFF